MGRNNGKDGLLRRDIDAHAEGRRESEFVEENR